MKALLRGIAALAWTGGLSLLVAGVWTWWRAPNEVSPQPWLVVAPGVFSVGEVPLGQNRLVAFRVTNESGTRPVQLLGTQNFCFPEGCVNSKGWPMTIPPGGSATVEIEYQGTKAGKFACDVPLFTDSPGQAVISLAIVGENAAAAAAVSS